MANKEDIAAENILKRAELARITRQLKTRLSQTNLKRLKDKTNESNNFKPHSTGKVLKKRSIESLTDANRTEDESDSPIKRTQYPPSSPNYDDFTIPPVPKTPPQQKITLNTDIYNTASTNKTQVHYSSPAQPSSVSKGIMSTPKHQSSSRDEGADLLMFLATSPSPVQYKNVPSTPSKSIKNSLQVPSSQRNGFTPATPKNRLKTPGFNMNDYVNLFTPSPGMARTPADLNKDVNGKFIKF